MLGVRFTGVSFLALPKALTSQERRNIQEFVASSDYSDVDDHVRFFATRSQKPELHGGVRLFAELLSQRFGMPVTDLYAYDDSILPEVVQAGRYDPVIERLNRGALSARETQPTRFMG